MPEKLRILLLEDVDTDAELIQYELRRARLSFSIERVSNKKTFIQAINKCEPHLILADYSLPGFDGLTALKITREKYPEVPFVFVSGAIGEDHAIETLKLGATDYVLKDRLSRLVPAVKRALQEAEEKRARRQAEQALKKSYDELEIKVRERTAELTRINEELKREIHERKCMEVALRDSENRFRRLVENAADAFFLIDEAGHIVDVNQEACRSLGWDREKLLNKTVFDISLTMQPKKFEQIKTSIKPDQPITLEGWHLRKDGSKFPVEVRICLLRSEGKDYLLALARDITERKKAEAAIRESQERLSRILESAMDAIVTIDASSNIVLFNQAAEKMFQCSAEKVIGTSLDRFLSDNFKKLIKDYIKKSRTRKSKSQYLWAPEGLTAQRIDGELFPVEATISQAEASGQQLFTIILRDINDRKKAEAELTRLHSQNIYLQEEIQAEYNFDEIIGESEPMRQVYENIKKVAATDSTVLLIGETGTGKELIARAIHNFSQRKDRVLIKVNCAALPSGLVESELFGHEKGAFTGAITRKKGRFELADGGTIFLDEVGELPLETQAKLLRVLQEQEFERVGGHQTLHVDVRVIAATNRNLQEAVNHGAFRADLFYRLNIFPIVIPPLRDRLEDIPLLTQYFVKKFSQRVGKRIDKIAPATLEKLILYSWPGNVRELANVLERAVILCEGGTLKPENIFISAQEPEKDNVFCTLEEAERAHILKALKKTHGVVAGPHGAARLLGINRSTLISRMKKLGIQKHHIR